MLGQEPGKSVKQSETKQMEVRQRHPAFTVSKDATVTPGRTVRPQVQDVIISPAMKQLNREGYVVYNSPEKQDVYITIQPESAFFEDEEPRMVRMAAGSFVGADKRSSSADMPARSEQGPEPMAYTQPADIFSNACRREDPEEIDFNEVIIKKNESFEMEFEEAPEFFKPDYEGVSDPVAEESFIEPMGEAEVAATASAGTKAEGESTSFAGYREEPEYEVQAVPAENAPVTEVPAGLYVDGYRPIDSAEADDDEADELSSFMGAMPAEVETAVTSESAPAPETIHVMDIISGPDAMQDYETAPESEAILESETMADSEVTSDIDIMPDSEAAPDSEMTPEAVSEETTDSEMTTDLEIMPEATPDSEMILDSEVMPDSGTMSEPEAAPCLETIPASEAVVSQSTEVLSLPAPKEAELAGEAICEAVAEEGSETVADVPVQIEVFDEVADIMRITIPSLRMSDDLILELSRDQERTIPDDGLETYDCMFRPVKMPVKEEISCTSSASEGKRPLRKPDPYSNFRVD